MIELRHETLVFTFPEVHSDAKLRINFQRTLRIPDDGKDYPLPPGLGNFPLTHIDDHHDRVPEQWLKHGGVMLPMYQSEAMWLNFSTSNIELQAKYPFAIKIATGKKNAVSGGDWSEKLHRKPQDYVVAPEQPWLDGYCFEKGFIRQFVAMPLGAGYTAEEQITGEAEHGGLQILVCPMKRDIFERRFPKREAIIARQYDGATTERFAAPMAAAAPDMGLAPGGRMRQEIYDDPFKKSDWDTNHSSRCFVHIANSMVWRSITGQLPPTPPPTARDYSLQGLPWFDYYYEDAKPIKGSKILKGLKSVVQLGKEKGDVPLPENESTDNDHVINIRAGLKPGQVREGSFLAAES